MNPYLIRAAALSLFLTLMTSSFAQTVGERVPAPVDKTVLERVRTLGKRKITDYFPEAKQAPKARDTELNAANAEAFERDLKTLVRDLRKGGFRDDEFNDWWEKAGKAKYLTRAQMYALRGKTMDEFFGQASQEAIIFHISPSEDVEGWVIRTIQSIHNPYIEGALISTGAIFRKQLMDFADLLKRVMIFGPGVQIVNVAVDPLLKPMLTWLQKSSIKFWRYPAILLNNFFSAEKQVKSAGEMSEKDLTKLKEEMKLLDFAGMTPTQAQENWNRLKDNFIKIDQVWQASLPTYLRDARNTAMMTVREARGYLTAARLTHSSYEQHRRWLVDKLLNKMDLAHINRILNEQKISFEPTGDAQSDQKMAAVRSELQKAGLTADEITEFAREHGNMAHAKEELARHVYEWLFFRFSYPELGRLLAEVDVAPDVFDIVNKDLGSHFYMEKVLPRLQQMLDEKQIQIDAKAHLMEEVAKFAKDGIKSLTPPKDPAQMTAEEKDAHDRKVSNVAACIRDSVKNVGKEH